MTYSYYTNSNVANYLYFLNALHEHFKKAKIDEIENGYSSGSIDVENVFDMLVAPEVHYIEVDQYFYCDCEDPSETRFHFCCQHGEYQVNLLHCCNRTILENV